ncbi:recombinase family protein [Streptomyces sp. NPDC056721]|uniref:recombinase family protein n=1 Tax=unclassified Streptomyces TaxID=2593676 RepID=UPI003680F560
MTQTLTGAITVVQPPLGSGQLRAVAYLRISTEVQKKGYGIAYAKKGITKHIEKKGWALVGTYTDAGVSGTLEAAKRDELPRLMKDARRNPRAFDVVVVNEERAIGRRNRAFWPWVWELQDLGIFVAIVNGEYDNSTEEGESRMRKAADVAHDELKLIRDRTQGGVQEKASDGGYAGGRPRYGYRIENKGRKRESRLVLDLCDCPAACSVLHEAVVLRRARSLVIECQGDWSKAALRLNAEGSFGRDGKPWSKDNLRNKLTNEDFLEGFQVWRNPKNRKTGTRRGVTVGADGRSPFGETVVIELPPVFTPQEVKELRQFLQQRGPVAGARPYPLSGRLTSQCGRQYFGGGGKKRQYRCAGKTPEYAGAKRCSCPVLDAKLVENEVWARVCDMVGDTEQLKHLAAHQLEKHAGEQVDYGRRIEEFHQQIEDSEAAIAVATAAAARQAARRGLAGKAAEQTIDRTLAPLNGELAETERLLAETIAWKHETEATTQRDQDICALAEMTRAQRENILPGQQPRYLKVLSVKATVLRVPPPRAPGRPCALVSWFWENKRLVPELTDAAWAKVQHLMGTHWALDPRQILGALLHKARTGSNWADLYEAFDSRSLRTYWTRWQASGLWESVMKNLADEPGMAAFKAPPRIPELHIEGDIKLRVALDTKATE